MKPAARTATGSGHFHFSRCLRRSLTERDVSRPRRIWQDSPQVEKQEPRQNRALAADCRPKKKAPSQPAPNVNRIATTLF